VLKRGLIRWPNDQMLWKWRKEQNSGGEGAVGEEDWRKNEDATVGGLAILAAGAAGDVEFDAEGGVKVSLESDKFASK